MAKLYRTMRATADGLPECGASFSTLGARPDKDIAVDDAGRVEPATGGMSTTLDDPKKMKKPARPRALGGESRQPLFVLEVGALPPTLLHRPESPAEKHHHFVEPATSTTFDDYQASLHGTRADWKTS